MEDARLALIGPNGVVENVIAGPAGVGPEWPGEVLGLPGVWVLDPDVQAGVGFTYDAATGAFLAPPGDEDPPAETGETDAQAPSTPQD